MALWPDREEQSGVEIEPSADFEAPALDDNYTATQDDRYSLTDVVTFPMGNGIPSGLFHDRSITPPSHL